MITETGRVIALKGDQAWVQTIRASACQSCSARSGCGQRVLATATGGRANQVLVANTVDAVVGDDVTIGIDERALLGASLIVYAIPLLLLIIGSLSAHQLSGGSDGWSITGALVGLASGVLASSTLQRRGRQQYEPKLLRVNRIPSGTCL
ncbi:MAG: sigma E positive regulator RseC/MucC [Gammaproteobacteria bacterium]|uniref:Sigma factor RpoE regulatory protein RseC n=1 Tax=Marinobacter nitratireducens TaxID=1137280 RepID=A0A072N0N4_9GAMM|nr:SoxR reducing system RseC family protein [Marinobacter nitratireducens]KEF31071.1 Sigma factor RpoE regulatory protein RseC [Marinobacter nitratireducens]TNE75042.1 MAG: sigma E positive regulator RseC/MucC [Gammaproteobacteria bacterium]